MCHYHRHTLRIRDDAMHGNAHWIIVYEGGELAPMNIIGTRY